MFSFDPPRGIGNFLGDKELDLKKRLNEYEIPQCVLVDVAKSRLWIPAGGSPTVRDFDRARHGGFRRPPFQPGGIHVQRGDEPCGNYNRIKLVTKLKESDLPDFFLNTPEWYAEHGVETILGQPVVSINRQARTATLADGRSLPPSPFPKERGVLVTGGVWRRLGGYGRGPGHQPC